MTSVTNQDTKIPMNEDNNIPTNNINDIRNDYKKNIIKDPNIIQNYDYTNSSNSSVLQPPFSQSSGGTKKQRKNRRKSQKRRKTQKRRKSQKRKHRR